MQPRHLAFAYTRPNHNDSIMANPIDVLFYIISFNHETFVNPISPYLLHDRTREQQSAATMEKLGSMLPFANQDYAIPILWHDIMTN